MTETERHIAALAKGAKTLVVVQEVGDGVYKTSVVGKLPGIAHGLAALLKGMAEDVAASYEELKPLLPDVWSLLATSKGAATK